MNDKTKSFWKGVIIAAGGAGIAFIADAATAGSLGEYSALIGMVASIALNAIKKYAIDED